MKVYLLDGVESITAEQLERDLALLPQWRREVALDYKNSLGLVQCVESFLLLQRALAEVWGITGEVEFEVGEHGKPALKGLPAVHFNLSHCRRAVMCVVDDAPVGCDVETIRPKINEALVRKCMNADEQASIAAADEPAVEFARLWTMKEAVVKLTGQGLTVPLHEILVDIPHISIETHVDRNHGYVYSIAKQK